MNHEVDLKYSSILYRMDNNMKKPLFKEIGGYFYQKNEAEKLANFFKNYDHFVRKVQNFLEV